MGVSSLQDDVETVTGLLVGELAPSRTDFERPENSKESLYVTGIDPTIAAMALKVVLGIAASFLGRLFYDRWKAARTRGHLDSLAKEISGRLEGELPKGEAVDSDKLRADVLGLLTLEGLSEEQARAVFDQALAVISERFRRGG
jgi:hypothetical protein